MAQHRAQPMNLHNRATARTLAGVESIVALLGAAGGLLLAVKPNGSLLGADLSALSGSPFSSWRAPGVLLMLLVGGGFVVAALSEWTGAWFARGVSIVAGAGLIVFEICEFVWLGFQGLELIFALIGLTVLVLAARASASDGTGSAR